MILFLSEGTFCLPFLFLFLTHWIFRRRLFNFIYLKFCIFFLLLISCSIPLGSEEIFDIISVCRQECFLPCSCASRTTCTLQLVRAGPQLQGPFRIYRTEFGGLTSSDFWTMAKTDGASMQAS